MEVKLFITLGRSTLSMKQRLNYGRISWSYEDFDPKVACRPIPLLTFPSIRINGKLKHLHFSDKVWFQLLKLKSPQKISFKEAYRKWFYDRSWTDHDLGEGRSFLRWLQKNKISIQWNKDDLQFHAFFMLNDAPKHELNDELAQNLSFAIPPVTVEGRKVKLYLQDDAVLGLINMPYGEDHDFLDLVKQYIKLRFQWEQWQAPAIPFLDWVKSQAKRPVFLGGQLGLNMSF